MKFIWRMSYAHLKVAKLRTILTITGIVVGTISVLAMTSVGTGVTDYINQIQESEGSIREILVSPHKISETNTKHINNSSIEELKKLAGVESVYPVNNYYLELEYEYEYVKYSTWAEVIGVPPEYLESLGLLEGDYPKDSGIRPELFASGAFTETFLPADTHGGYGWTLRDEMKFYENRSTMTGETVYAKDPFSSMEESFKLTICGTNRKKENPNVYARLDSLIRMMKYHAPNGIVQTQPTDANGDPYPVWIYDGAIVMVEDSDLVEEVTKAIRNAGYDAENHLEVYAALKKITDAVMLAFGSIGFIALIVAVIGIINTMSTAIYDRRKEICLLKLLGCDRDDLLLLILTESGFMGVTGGFGGLVLTLLGIHLILNPLARILLKLDGLTLARMPLSAAVFTILGAILISIIAGIYPANMARKMKATEVIN